MKIVRLKTWTNIMQKQMGYKPKYILHEQTTEDGEVIYCKDLKYPLLVAHSNVVVNGDGIKTTQFFIDLFENAQKEWQEFKKSGREDLGEISEYHGFDQ